MTDLINIGLSGIRAYSASLRMVGENIANADDPAYARRRVQLTEAPVAVRGSPLYRTQIGTPGVEIAGVARSVDPLLDAALRRAETVRSDTASRADWTARIETALGDGAQGVGARMTAFFNAGTRAAASPNDPARRLDMLDGLSRVSTGFAATGARLDALAGDLDGAISSTTIALNSDLATLVGINRDLRAARPGSDGQAQLLDRRDTAIRSITGALPADISFDRHGAATLNVSGTTVVTPTTVETVTASRTGTGGIILATGGGSPVAISGGALSGLHRSGEALSDARAALDDQAAQFVTAINGWNSGGTTPSGAAGPALLSGTSAATIGLVTQDPDSIAATTGGNPAGNLLALDGLRGTSGSEAAWSRLIASNAIDTRSARADAEAAAIFADHAAAARQDVSGVDLDQEAAEMLRLQQAYGAAARVLQVARDTVQTILDIV